MARKHEPLNFAGSLEVQSQKPLDGRRTVTLIADLTDAASFPYIYKGLDVFCEENSKWYTFLGGDQTDITNWREEGSGGGGSTDWSDITNKPTDLVQDASYVHTDNNYTTSDKGKLASLENYDDTALAARVTANETAIADRYTKAEADALLADKADKATTYTKAETDALVEGEHIELTQAQYTALPEEEKNNGKVYFITDGGAYVPAVDLIPYVNQAPIVVGKLDLRGDGEFRDIKRVRLWISDLQNASEIITAGWVETGVYVRPIRIYGWFTFHDTVNTPTSWEYRIQQLPIPYSGYKLIESPSGSTDTIGLKFHVDHSNKLRMVVDGKSKFHTEDYACVIIDFMETPIT